MYGSLMYGFVAGDVRLAQRRRERRAGRDIFDSKGTLWTLKSCYISEADDGISVAGFPSLMCEGQQSKE